MWDSGHRSETLLAIGSALLASRNFGDGLGAAAQNLLGLKRNLQQEERQQHEFGGPDDAFEIITDPKTGQRTVKEVPVFQDYLTRKRTKAKETADINGRAMFALSKLPEADRPAAYAAMLANPDQFGIDPATMPAAYDPRYVSLAGQMGMTVAQAQTGERQNGRDAASERYRADVQKDRIDRTNIYRARSMAATTQGADRISIARAKGLPKARPAGGSADPRYEYRMGPNGQMQKRLKR